MTIKAKEPGDQHASKAHFFSENEEKQISEQDAIKGFPDE
jgi:hypothetical protein